MNNTYVIVIYLKLQCYQILKDFSIFKDWGHGEGIQFVNVLVGGEIVIKMCL